MVTEGYMYQEPKRSVEKLFSASRREFLQARCCSTDVTELKNIVRNQTFSSKIIIIRPFLQR